MRKQIIHGRFDGKINYQFNKLGRFNGIINLINDGGFKWEINYQWGIWMGKLSINGGFSIAGRSPSSFLFVHPLK